MAVTAAYRLRIDWADTGLVTTGSVDSLGTMTVDDLGTMTVDELIDVVWAGDPDDATADLRLNPELFCGRGRDVAREYLPPIAGQLAFSLDNVDGKYSSANPLSPLAGYILPGRPVALEATYVQTLTDAYAATVLADAPAGYWRLGEASGTVAADSSGGTNTGTYTGGVTLAQAGALVGDGDTAALFNGTTGYVTVPDSATLDLGDVFTAEAWVKVPALSAVYQILSKGAGSFSFFVNGSSSIRLSQEATVAIQDSSIALTAGVWQHVVATRSGATVKLYINGVDRTGTSLGSGTMTNTASALNIGRQVSAGDRLLAGSLDEVAVYPTALSAARVLAHYQAGMATLTHDVSTTYPLFRGYLETPTEQPYQTRALVHFEALDALAKLKAARVSTAMYTSIRTDQAIGYILDAIGWPAADRVLDTGRTTLARWWVDNVDAFTAIRDLMFTEGPGSIFYVDASGLLVFEGRHYRLLTPRCTTSQATFVSNGAEPMFASDFQYASGIGGVVNICTVPVRAYASTGGVTIWTATGLPLTFGPNEVRAFAVSTSTDGFSGATVTATPSAGSVGTSLDRTSGKTVTLTVTAGASGATLSALSVQATTWAITEQQVSQTIDTGDSQDLYGPRAYPDEFIPKWIPTTQEATDFCNAVTGRYQDPVPQVRIGISNGTEERLMQALARQISDRIHVVEDTRAFVDDDFTIEAITHEVSEGRNHRSHIAGERASNQSWWVLGDAALSLLGESTILGY